LELKKLKLQVCFSITLARLASNAVLTTSKNHANQQLSKTQPMLNC
jgi:hypothetical protein